MIAEGVVARIRFSSHVHNDTGLNPTWSELTLFHGGPMEWELRIPWLEYIYCYISRPYGGKEYQK